MKNILLLPLLLLSFGIFAEDVPFDYIPDNLPAIPDGAYVTAPQSQEEVSVGTEDLYGEQFDAFIFKKYPDIKKQKFIPDSIMRDDEDSLSMYKTGFYRALYFSKLITLSNGENLYNFLTKCAKLNRTVTFADREHAETNEFNIQYYFELKMSGNGKLVGESIYLKRHGNKFSAMRTPFAYFALSDKDFMKTYGLSCVK